MDEGDSDSDKTVRLEDYHKISLKRQMKSHGGRVRNAATGIEEGGDSDSDKTVRLEDYHCQPETTPPRRLTEEHSGLIQNASTSYELARDVNIGKQLVLSRFLGSNFDRPACIDSSSNDNRENQYSNSTRRDYEIKRELLNQVFDEVQDNTTHTDKNIIGIESSDDEHTVYDNSDKKVDEKKYPFPLNTPVTVKNDFEMGDLELTANDVPPPIANVNQPKIRIKVLNPKAINEQAAAKICSEVSNDDKTKPNKNIVGSIRSGDGGSMDNVIKDSTVYTATCSNENVSSSSVIQTVATNTSDKISESTNKNWKEAANHREDNTRNIKVNNTEIVAKSSTAERVELLIPENSKGNRYVENNRLLNINAVNRLSDKDTLHTTCKSMRTDHEELTKNVLHSVRNNDVKVDTNNHINTNILDICTNTQQKNSQNPDIVINEKKEKETSNTQNLKNLNEKKRIAKFLSKFCTFMMENLLQKCKNLSEDAENKNAFSKSARLLADEIQKLDGIEKADVQLNCPVCSRISTFTGICLYDYYNHDTEGKQQNRFKKCYLCYGFQKIYNTMMRPLLPMQSNKSDGAKSVESSQNIDGQKGQPITQKSGNPIKCNKDADNEAAINSISKLDISSKLDNDNNGNKGSVESINNKNKFENLKHITSPECVNKESDAANSFATLENKNNISQRTDSITLEGNISTIAKDSVGKEAISIETVHRHPVEVVISTSSTSKNNNDPEHIVDNLISKASNIPAIDTNLGKTIRSEKFDNVVKYHKVENNIIKTNVPNNEQGNKLISTTTSVESPFVKIPVTETKPIFVETKGNAQYMPIDRNSLSATPLPIVMEKIKKDHANVFRPGESSVSEGTNKPVIDKSTEKVYDINKRIPENNDTIDRKVDNLTAHKPKNKEMHKREKSSTNVHDVNMSITSFDNDISDHSSTKKVEKSSGTVKVRRKSKETSSRSVSENPIGKIPDENLPSLSKDKDRSYKLGNITTETPNVMPGDRCLSEESSVPNMAAKSKKDGTNQLKTADRLGGTAKARRHSKEMSSRYVGENAIGRTQGVNVPSKSKNNHSSDKLGHIIANTSTAMSVDRCENISKDDSSGHLKRAGDELVSKETSIKFAIKQPGQRVYDVKICETSSNVDISDHSTDNVHVLESKTRDTKVQDKQLSKGVHKRRVSSRLNNEDSCSTLRSDTKNQKIGTSVVNPTLSRDSSAVVEEKNLTNEKSLFNKHPKTNNDVSNSKNLITKEANILTLRAGDKKVSGEISVETQDSSSSKRPNSTPSNNEEVVNRVVDSVRIEKRDEKKINDLDRVSKTTTITAESVQGLVAKSNNNDTNLNISGVHVKTNPPVKASKRRISIDTSVFNIPPKINKDQIGNTSVHSIPSKPEANKEIIITSIPAELKSKKSNHPVSIDTKAANIVSTNNPNKNPRAGIFIDDKALTKVYYDNTHQRVDRVVTEANNFVLGAENSNHPASSFASVPTEAAKCRDNNHSAMSSRQKLAQLLLTDEDDCYKNTCEIPKTNKRNISTDETQTSPKRMKTNDVNIGSDDDVGNALSNKSSKNEIEDAMNHDLTVNETLTSVRVETTTKKNIDDSSNVRHDKGRFKSDEKDSFSVMREMLLCEDDEIMTNPGVHSTAISVSNNNQTKHITPEKSQNTKLTENHTESNNVNVNKAKDDHNPNEASIVKKANQRQEQENETSHEISKIIKKLENDENRDRVKKVVEEDSAKGVAEKSDGHNANGSGNVKENEANRLVLNSLDNRQEKSTTVVESEAETLFLETSRKIINSKILYECPICSCIFQDSKVFLGHLKSDHNLITPVVPETVELNNNSNQNNEAESVNKLNNSVTNTEVNVQNVERISTPHGREKYIYKCSICKDTLHTYYSARTHKREFHPKKKYIKIYERILIDSETGKQMMDTNLTSDDDDADDDSNGNNETTENEACDEDTNMKGDNTDNDENNEVHSNMYNEDVIIISDDDSNDVEQQNISDVMSSSPGKNNHEKNGQSDGKDSSTLDSNANSVNKDSENGNIIEFEEEAREDRNEANDELKPKPNDNVIKEGYKCKICNAVCRSKYECFMHRKIKHFQMRNRQLFDRVLLSRHTNNRDSTVKLRYAPGSSTSTQNSHNIVRFSSAGINYVNQNRSKESSNNEEQRNNQIYIVTGQISRSTVSPNFSNNLSSPDLMDDIADDNVQRGSKEQESDKANDQRTVHYRETNDRQTGDEISQNQSDQKIIQTNKLPAYILTCLECGYTTDIYDSVIGHCQNHYNNVIDPTTYCSMCQLNFDTYNFKSHQHLHSKHGNFKVVKYSFRSLFSDWDKVFDEIPVDIVKDFRKRSIYETNCIKMIVTENGPWEASLYTCGECRTCVPPQEIEQHSQEDCYFVSHPCPICRRCFTSFEMLVEHERNHSKSYRVVAFNKNKDKNFNRRLLEARKNHKDLMNETLVATLYKCVCDLCFATLNNFRIHFMRCNFVTKTGDLCSKCTMPFYFQTTELENHEKLHHGAMKCKLYVCLLTMVKQKVPVETDGKEVNTKDTTVSQSKAFLNNTAEMDIKRDLLKHDTTDSQD